MSSIVTIGSMAFDSIETPFGKEDKILGGSVNYFSLSACYFVPIRCVGIVGNDFPQEHLKVLEKQGIDTEGIKTVEGETFHWSGRYGEDPNERETLDTRLNVFESFKPDLPEKYRNSEFVFLGNIAPDLQMRVLGQITSPRFIALDTMNFWIEGQKDALLKAISKCHCLVINESEVKQLTETKNIVKAAEIIRKSGPQILVIKRGEYGALLFNGEEKFAIPALPLSVVKDPTGAGDSFAGGFMGYLAAQKDLSLNSTVLRNAIVYGSVMASFTVQDFGIRKLLELGQEDINKRYQEFVDLTLFSKNSLS